MSTQDPIGSNVPPERPRDPTHFGGDGLYDAPERENGDMKKALRGDGGASAFWDFAKRNHVPAVLAVGGVTLLLVSLIRRSTRG